MDEENGGGGAARNSPTFVSVGSRQRFTVELRPGETTIVSWKKLVKDASKAGGSTSAAKPPPVAIPELDSRLAPGQPAENEMVDGPPSRFSAVIEKIERLYMGKHSSDEEDLNDIPDDDEYDTEDSFIDDAELDEYFQVDNSAIKHDGFFVNRGKLERINEPNSLPNQQPKKRRRKDLEKRHGEGNDDHLPNKLVKVGKKAAGKSEQLLGGNMGLPHVVALPSVHNEDMKFQNQTSTSVICAKKNSSKTKTSLYPPLSSRVSNSDAALSLEDIDRQKPEMPPSKYQGSKSKDGIETSDALVQKSHEKSSHAQCKFEPGILSNNICELDQSVQWKEKDGNCERPDLNVSVGKITMQTAKAPVVQRKDGSSVRLKNTMLEKAIGELEKMVAESRPPTMEVQDADIASQVVKRRLPREVKQKLAKVARLAQASHGRISKELVNRLMSIVGHLVQLRTLKRNLKDMVNMGLTAKKEKDDRVQQMKKEVAELIRMRVPYIKSKVLEQQAGGSDDFQEMGIEEKEVIKRKYSMNDALEDKICDLYDLYVDGLDEDAGPQVRKLYAELAHLWPEGFMDNHGIKRAICRAKDRKRALYSRNKDQEKIKRKKLIPKTEETVRVDTSVAQSQLIQEKLVSESNNHGLTSVSKLVPSTTTINATVRILSSSANAPNLDWPKQEKVKGSSVILNEKSTADALAKKKVKRKPESELVEAHFRLEKSAFTQGDERIKSHKQVAGPPAKTSLPVPSTAAASAATTASSLPLNLNSPADMR